MVIHPWQKMVVVVSGIVPAVWRSPDEVSPGPADTRRFCLAFSFFPTKKVKRTDKTLERVDSIGSRSRPDGQTGNKTLWIFFCPLQHTQEPGAGQQFSDTVLLLELDLLRFLQR